MTAKPDLDARKRRVAWRRSDVWEAAFYFCGIFTLSNVLRVAWHAMFKDTIDYEKAFMHALIFAFVFAGVSIVLKVRPVFLR